MWNKVKHLDFDWLVADKAYDSEENHEAVYDAGKDSLISLKNANQPIYKTKGVHRKKAKREFEFGLYTQREITESIFSSLKRKYGSKLRARKFKTQKIELLCKILAFNIERAVRVIIEMIIYWRYFYRASLIFILNHKSLLSFLLFYEVNKDLDSVHSQE